MKGVSIAVYANKVEKIPVPLYKVSIKRTYKQNGEFKTVTSLLRDDLPVVQHLLEKAWITIFELEKKDHSTDGDNDQEDES